MKQLKILLFASIAMLFTTNANAVNMAPIITYLLSDTVREIPPTACDVNMTLDVNETTVICEWKYLPSANDTSTAIVSIQGNNGIFILSGDSLTYTKHTESNETDSGVLEITSGTKTTAVEVEINALYWKQVNGGSSFTIAIKSDGTLWGWGSNNGKLGDGTVHDSLVPVQEFTKGNDWSSVSAGWSHAAAIKSDGTLWSWGGNYDGQLGDGTEETRLVPTQEATKATNWTSVSTTYNHTTALKSDGSLWGWGNNYYGQLGDGTEEIDRNVSTQEVTGATDWIAVSAGNTHTVALKSDGTLWAWGANGWGQLCDGTKTYKMVPTKEVTGATDWVSVNAGDYLTTALKADGTIWSCGYGSYGQIGDGTTTVSVTVPTQEDTNATDWSSVSAGYYHVHAIKSDGTLWSWGKNDRGQLADGTEDHKSVPTPESTGDIDWVSVSAGSSNAHATKSDGTLWGWGANGSGALGDGTEVDRNVSTPILPRDYD